MEGKSYGKKKRCCYSPSLNLVHCFNCGWSSRPLKWIKEVTKLSYKEIFNEAGMSPQPVYNLDENDFFNNPQKEVKEEEEIPSDSINLLDPIQCEFYSNNETVQEAIKYVEKRRLNTAVNKPRAIYLSLTHYLHKNRIIIPFYGFDGHVQFYQSRFIGVKTNERLDNVRYLSKKDSQRSLFGVDTVSDEFDTVFLLEGPIDACFIRNGLGVAGVNLSRHRDLTEVQQTQISRFNDKKQIWCLDSQWKDKTSLEKTRKLLECGECVFVWPDDIGCRYKDFNDYCSSKGVDEFPMDIVLENSVCGEIGLLKLKKILFLQTVG